MIGRFKQSFGKDVMEEWELPKEVLDALNQSLPAGITYKKNDAGEYLPTVVDFANISFETNCYFDREEDKQVIEKLKQIPKDSWPEYLHRIQQPIKIKEAMVGNEELMVPWAELHQNPLSDERVTISNGRLFSRFASPVSVAIENPEGDRITVSIGQDKHDSFYETKFVNYDYPALKIEIYLYNPLDGITGEGENTSQEHPVKWRCSVVAKAAKSTGEALKALRIFRSLYNKSAIIQGVRGAVKTDFITTDEPKWLEDAIEFWEGADKLEELLGVRFDPASDFPEEDANSFEFLRQGLINKKRIVWRHPFEHFHVVGDPMAADEGDDDNTQRIFRFLEGPLSFSILGADFEVYSITTMQDFIVTNIEWDDDSKQSGEVYLSDAPGKQWALARKYVTKKEASKILQRIADA